MKEDVFIEVKCFEKELVLDFLENGLADLPPEFSLTYFGSGERPVKKPQFEIANREYFEEYLRRHEHSATLFGDGFTLFVSPGEIVPSSISFYISRWPEGRILQVGQLFEKLDFYRMTYAYGAPYKEMDSRNGHTFRLSTSTRPGHGWVGRDFRKYVPGLYWINYFSDKYASQHLIDIPRLCKNLNVEPTRLRNGFVLRLYERPFDWHEHAPRIENVIFNTTGFFSKRRVRLPEVVTPTELQEMLVRLGREWP